MQSFISGPRFIAVIIAIAIAAFTVILSASVGIATMLAGLCKSSDLPAWVQAVGAILAIVVGFATIYYQRVAEINDQRATQTINARVALVVAVQAMMSLGERLDALLAPDRNKHPYRLRGARATEMIVSLRELDTTHVPPGLVENFLQLRSNLFALNERITEIYDSENISNAAPRGRSERPQRMVGGLEIWASSRKLLDQIRKSMTEAGHRDLAEVPQAFAFEETASLSRLRT
jgi:hypothetical protein